MSETDTIVKGWHGKLNLVYADRSNSTQLIYNHQQAPLKVQRPFYPEGEKVCHSVILHTAGGVVGGDRLSYNLHLQPNAQALITTAAAGKVYRSDGLQARQTIEIKIDAGACLEWLPQETILFNGAIYRQDLRVELATGANFLGWEITRFGRSARGEKFYQGEWRSHTEIWQQGVPLWIDRQWLPGNDAVFHSPHGLAGQPIVGSLVWLGSPISTEIIEKARNLGNTQGEAGVTSLENGFLCRYRGASTSEVRNWFTSVWQLLRGEFFSRGKCIPRVWQT
ncbi:urease accessory protein UreD [Anabaena sp. FACHB-709]|uniref:Urease accessory protein UreD n=3 Tax=Nostocaceae TaxID=1162 RepID=URED_NOSS1|nr:MULTISPECIES: urease accessory protein UreD [Nostocaceae]Q8YQZ4.1 RecName: Full=Urease accessory protein UreD [Nostoc sp. PCC 7120 = FACHB-418]BAY69293.1 urease accessory protein D [Trichormus variabilis NIES-23]HBW30754.1 urease accessory protein UreD [Nostoc sp. UBA8866]MBD2174685.1 urease accessory protein UreD [Anabaena cylindrica FACHB-318]MBD2266446.1 urease accessory protein UreD [Anabaena sp. FACHB-709]MBD2275858.1 urease accessory protein UreD [Nostoc sp. PCC 7120 = FACHB-418]